VRRGAQERLQAEEQVEVARRGLRGGKLQGWAK